jgi:hypothetical protein
MRAIDHVLPALTTDLVYVAYATLLAAAELRLPRGLGRFGD